MAFVRIPGGAFIFAPVIPAGLAQYQAATTNWAMTASAHKIALIFQIPRDGTLDSFEFRLGSVTQAPSNGLKVSFQDLDSSGDPDGTADQFRIKTTGITANSWFQVGLITSDGTDGGTKRTVVAGAWMAAVIEFASFNASDSITIANFDVGTSGFNTPCAKACYGSRFTATWDHGSTRGPLLCVLKYDDGYEAPSTHVFPIVSFSSTGVASSSTPDEIALRYKLPFDHEIMGIWARLLCAQEVGTFDVVLYNSVDSVLDSVSLTGAQVRGFGANSNENIYIPLSRYSPVGGNAVHRVAFKPTNNNAVTIFHFDVPSNAHLEAVDGGIEAYMSTRTDGGAWTDATTTRPWIGLKLSRIEADAAASGGGSSVFLG